MPFVIALVMLEMIPRPTVSLMPVPFLEVSLLIMLLTAAVPHPSAWR